MRTRTWDPNGDIYMEEVVQKQAVLGGFIFLSCFCIFGDTATNDNLGPQTPEMTEPTHASVRKNNVMGVEMNYFPE